MALAMFFLGGGGVEEGGRGAGGKGYTVKITGNLTKFIDS